VSITVSSPLSATCSLGSSATPITVHLSTADGSSWDPTTGGFSMVDKTFVTPAPSCPSSSLVEGLVKALIGSTTTPGNNLISIVGTALRQADPVVPPVTNPTITSTPTTALTPGSGSSTAPETPAIAPPAAPKPTVACVVPKLVGKNLKQAKRALRKAHCKVGKSKKKNSNKKKKGRILKQRYKAGTKLPAGTKIPITVSRGPKTARKHRSG
jgi:hypothetical protein